MSRHTLARVRTLKRIPPSKKYQRLLAEFTGEIAEFTYDTFEKMVIKKLNAKQVEQLSTGGAGLLDKAPTKETKSEKKARGNVNAIGALGTYGTLAKKRINEKYPKKLIKKKVRNILSGAAKQTRDLINSDISVKFDISKKALNAKFGVNTKLERYVANTSRIVAKLRDDGITALTDNSIRIATEGGDISKVVEEMIKNKAKFKNGSKFIARNQIASFNSISTKLYHQKLGITQGIWHTNVDGRERSSHKSRDKKKFSLAKGLHDPGDGDTLFPGVAWNCRCTHTAVMPDSLNL